MAKKLNDAFNEFIWSIWVNKATSSTSDDPILVNLIYAQEGPDPSILWAN
jgi:hypothetical protein